MPPTMQRALGCLALLLLAAAQARALSFQLMAEETRCVQEDVNEDVLILGEYEVGEHDNLEVTLEVRAAREAVARRGEREREEGREKGKSFVILSRFSFAFPFVLAPVLFPLSLSLSSLSPPSFSCTYPSLSSRAARQARGGCARGLPGHATGFSLVLSPSLTGSTSLPLRSAGSGQWRRALCFASAVLGKPEALGVRRCDGLRQGAPLALPL